MKRKISALARRIKAFLRKLRNGFRWFAASEVVCCDPKEAIRKLSEVAPSPGSSAMTDNHVGPANFDLTIIVPAYNAEKWLVECAESILTQKTQYTFQAIFVDDGSKDHTAEILDGYASDPRVRVIHQENRGHSGARNTALKLLHSKYVMFVDSDDILLPGAVDRLLCTAYSNGADVVEGGAYAFNETGRLYEMRKDDHFHTRENLIGAPWAKVISTDIMARLEFPEGYLYEDTIMAMLVFPQAKVISTISDEVYGYRIHSASITQTHTAEMNRVHSFWIMLLMHDHMKELGISKDYNSYCLTMRHIIFTYRRAVLLPDEVKKWIFISTRAFVLENYSEYCNTKDKYYKLSCALQKYQYGKYCVLCETLN